MLLKNGSIGDDVKKIQQKLGLSPDGKFGTKTETAVKNWQLKNGLPPDGIVGDNTWRKMFEGDAFSPTPSPPPIVIAPSINTINLNLDKLKGHIPDSVLAQISECATKFNLTNLYRLAHVLGQCAHESAGFKILSENLNYSANGLKKIFGKYFPGNLNESYAKKPEKIASRVYANRMGNGDEASKDGYTYRGRGAIQLTGKDNYAAFAKAVGEDLIANPDLVSTKYSVVSAFWFFDKNKLWSLCDKGVDDVTITAVTKRVNGGTHGIDERIKKTKDFYKLLA